MKMMNKVCALVLSVALCAGMAAPAFAYGGEPVEEVEQPVLTATPDESHLGAGNAAERHSSHQQPL